jgi:hypothetical protein
LRTRLWFQAVKLQSDLPSAYAIEQALEGRPSGDQVWRPRKWDAYERGRKVPSRGGDPARGADAVALADTAYPGTAKWFDSPLWGILRLEHIGPMELEQALRSLDASVVQRLFHHASIGGMPVRLVPRPLTQEDLQALAGLGSFDALVATVLLVQQSDLMGSPDLREWALACYETLQPAIADAPHTRTLYPELFNHIDKACPHWVYASPNQRMRMHVFWHEYARRSWAGVRMPFIDQEIQRLRDERDQRRSRRNAQVGKDS